MFILLLVPLERIAEQEVNSVPPSFQQPFNDNRIKLILILGRQLVSSYRDVAVFEYAS